MKVRHMKSVQKAESAAWNTLFCFTVCIKMDERQIEMTNIIFLR